MTTRQIRHAKRVVPATPVVSAVAVSNISDTGFLVTWTTDIASTSQVEFGLDVAIYGSLTAVFDAVTPVTAHRVAVGGLVAGTLYAIRVRSVNGTSLTGTGTTTGTTAAKAAGAAGTVIFNELVATGQDAGNGGSGWGPHIQRIARTPSGLLASTECVWDGGSHVLGSDHVRNWNVRTRTAVNTWTQTAGPTGGSSGQNSAAVVSDRQGRTVLGTFGHTVPNVVGNNLVPNVYRDAGADALTPWTRFDLLGRGGTVVSLVSDAPATWYAPYQYHYKGFDVGPNGELAFVQGGVDSGAHAEISGNSGSIKYGWYRPSDGLWRFNEVLLTTGVNSSHLRYPYPKWDSKGGLYVLFMNGADAATLPLTQPNYTGGSGAIWAYTAVWLFYTPDPDKQPLRAIGAVTGTNVHNGDASGGMQYDQPLHYITQGNNTTDGTVAWIECIYQDFFIDSQDRAHVVYTTWDDSGGAKNSSILIGHHALFQYGKLVFDERNGMNSGAPNFWGANTQHLYEDSTGTFWYVTHTFGDTSTWFIFKCTGSDGSGLVNGAFGDGTQFAMATAHTGNSDWYWIARPAPGTSPTDDLDILYNSFTVGSDGDTSLRYIKLRLR